jgi:predicted dienelactone hydrolase
MRRLFFTAILLLIGPISVASGEAAQFDAGITRFSVADAAPFDVLVWYPTAAEEVPWRTGPFMIPASRNAAIASGRFPIVLLSHGGGLTGGTPLVLRELSANLARQGFVVVAPFHGKTGLQARPFQVKLALDALLADAHFTAHVDPTRLGMLGFSLGTAVTLELAGAIPNMAHLIAYCGAHPDDVMSCDHAPDGKHVPAPGQSSPVGAASLPSPLPLKAIALLDPFGVLFQREELTAVTMPVLLFRPDKSELPGEANAFGLAAALPHPPQINIVPGGHFIFVDVCPSELRSAAPEACQDPPGVDRVAVHTEIEAQIAKFFSANL